MIMTPFDIVSVLTAAAPIAASLASIANKNSSEEEKKNKENSSKPVNVTINNHFYTNSEEEAKVAASKIQDQLIECIVSSKNRYII